MIKIEIIINKEIMYIPIYHIPDNYLLKADKYDKKKRMGLYKLDNCNYVLRFEYDTYLNGKPHIVKLDIIYSYSKIKMGLKNLYNKMKKKNSIKADKEENMRELYNIFLELVKNRGYDNEDLDFLLSQITQKYGNLIEIRMSKLDITRHFDNITIFRRYDNIKEVIKYLERKNTFTRRKY